MIFTVPTSRRRVPVRLCDLPLDIRLRAATVACRNEEHPHERVLIKVAAVFPSATVYYVENPEPQLEAA